MDSMFDCKEPCKVNTYNDGTKISCVECEGGYEAPRGASICTKIQPKECPAGYSGLPDCQPPCAAGTYQDGSKGSCTGCPEGFTSLPAAASCNITIVPTSEC